MVRRVAIGTGAPLRQDPKCGIDKRLRTRARLRDIDEHSRPKRLTRRAVDVMEAFRRQVHADSRVRKHDLVGGAQETCHRRSHDRCRAGRIEPDREAFAHAARPMSDEHRHGPPVREGPSWRNELEPAAPDSGLALLRRQHVPLVRQIAGDESPEDAPRDDGVAAARRVAQVDDQRARVAEVVESAIECLDRRAVAKRVVEAHVADAAGEPRMADRIRVARAELIARFQLECPHHVALPYLQETLDTVPSGKHGPQRPVACRSHRVRIRATEPCIDGVRDRRVVDAHHDVEELGGKWQRP
jgi:hypothetical protein